MPPPVEADDRAWALYKKADSDAGDDCRDRLDAVDAVVKGWTHGSVQKPDSGRVTE